MLGHVALLVPARRMLLLEREAEMHANRVMAFLVGFLGTLILVAMAARH